MQGNGREETAMIDLVVRGDTVVTPQGANRAKSVVIKRVGDS
jgi:hypothetical protein